MVGAAGFHESDGAGQCRAVAGLQAGGEVGSVGNAPAQMRTAVPEAVTISIEPFWPTVS